MTRSLFISDLHLSEDTPYIEQGLTTFLKQEGDIDRLFLLGDIFEAWIGDDDDSPLAQRFATAMKSIADTGTQIYFTRGNRDFLVGQNYWVHSVRSFPVTPGGLGVLVPLSY